MTGIFKVIQYVDEPPAPPSIYCTEGEALRAKYRASSIYRHLTILSYSVKKKLIIF